MESQSRDHPGSGPARAGAGLRVFGWTSRRFRASRAPLRKLSGASSRVCRRLARRAGGEVTYRDRWGHIRRGDLQDDMELAGFIGEDSLPAEVRHRVAPGAWVVDAGANVGNITSELCALVGRRGRVWAVEPVPRNIARLESLKVDNRLDALEVLPVAVGAGGGTATLRLPEPGRSGWASVSASWQKGGTLEVPVRTIDQMVAESSIRGPMALLKIDVEGSEAAVLEGARATLEAMHPLIYCEFNDVILRDSGSSSLELLDRFRAAGYWPVDAGAVENGRLNGRNVDILLAAGP